MGMIRICWNKYALHLKNWYATTYSNRPDAMKDANALNSAVTFYGDQFSDEHVKWNVDIMAGLIREQAMRYGASAYAANTAEIYAKNTLESYMSRCVKETGGFAPDVECMSDNDCPRGYRCRSNECIKTAEEPEDDPLFPSLPSLPSIPSFPDTNGIKRGLQVSALVLIGVILLIVYMLTGRGGKKGGVTVVT